jgi:hypothetical protein
MYINYFFTGYSLLISLLCYKFFYYKICCFIFLTSVCFPSLKQFCSAELLGFKFTVPCNVEEILSANYGNKSKWSVPVENGYHSNIDWPNGVERSELDSPYTVRFFHKNGTIDVKRTVSEINIYYARFNKTLYSLPNDDYKLL